MKRALVLAAALIAFALPAQAVAGPMGLAQVAQEEQGPAVVIDEGEGAPEEVAWTFRFLVPTLLVMTLALVVGLLVAYQLRLKRRYKVVE